MRAWIDSRYRFPRIPLYVFFGPELPDWLSIMFAFSGLLIALYFLVAWYSAPEILGFLWYGINGLLATAAIARTREISTKSAGEIAEAAKAWGQNDDITVVTVRRTA